MSFDWQQSTKERYFRKVEEIIKEVNLEGFLEVDRSKFAIKEDKVKVFFVRIRRTGSTKKWYEARRLIEGLQELPVERDNCGKPIKGVYISGYIVLDMEEQDK